MGPNQELRSPPAPPALRNTLGNRSSRPSAQNRSRITGRACDCDTLACAACAAESQGSCGAQNALQLVHGIPQTLHALKEPVVVAEILRTCGGSGERGHGLITCSHRHASSESSRGRTNVAHATSPATCRLDAVILASYSLIVGVIDSDE